MSAAGLRPICSIEPEWAGERCFVICSGESVKAQAKQIARLKGRIIAVKHGVLLRPDADVLFLAGEESVERDLVPRYRGKRIIVRGRSPLPWLPPDTWHVTRSKQHDKLLDLRSPAHVGGYDLGTSAIHLAHLFGPTEIVVLGMDMQGGHFCPHPMQHPPDSHFRRHLKPMKAFAADARAKGVRIVNCSPVSKVEAFERQPLEKFL
jgi:hypothetical protein